MKRLILVLLLIAAAAAADLDTAILSIESQAISPYPVEPGKDFTVRIRVFNDGEVVAKDLRLDPQAQDIFLLSGRDDALESFSLCSRCSKDVLFYFTVAGDVKSGDYPLRFSITDGMTKYEKTLAIKVTGVPDLVVEAEAVGAVNPKGTFDVELTITNKGTGAASNIRVTPGTDDFIALGSDVLYVGELRSASQVTKKMTFMAADSLEAGPAQLVLSISYKDEQASSYAGEQAIGIPVRSSVKLDISSFSVTPPMPRQGDDVQLVVRVENLGEGQAENIRVEAGCPLLEGTAKAYIGRLDEDEDAPAYFTLKALRSGSCDLSAKLTFVDDSGEHTIEESIQMDIGSPKAGPGIFYAGGVLLVGALLFVKYRKR